MPNAPLVLEARAYPKVNIALKVGAKDPSSSLHPIRSRFCLALGDLFDLICFRLCWDCRDWPSLVLQGNFDFPLESNLIYKAYVALMQASSYLPSLPKDDQPLVFKTVPSKSSNAKNILYIEVKKSLPLGGGLGGGSSNAALTLVVLNEILGLGLGLGDLMQCAMGIGSDVCFFVAIYLQGGASLHPFFLQNAPSKPLDFTSASVGGVGDVVVPFHEDCLGFKLHLSGISCDTRAVYGEFDKLSAKTMDIDLSLDSKNLLASFDAYELNDLFLPASRIYPLRVIYERLSEDYGRVFFSGSGSSFFWI